MGCFGCPAGGVVCRDGWAVPGSRPLTHQAPRVEGAGLDVGAAGQGQGSFLQKAAGWEEGRATLHAGVLPHEIG
jgi:hypothetical protein